MRRDFRTTACVTFADCLRLYSRRSKRNLDSKSNELDRALGGLSQFAQKWGIAQLEDDFKRVCDASRELGRFPKFQAANKLLSKFADPTAWTIHVADNPDPEAGFLTMILQDGVFLAMNAIITARGIIRAHYPEIAKSKGD